MGRKKKDFVSQEYSESKGGKNLKEGTKKSRALTIFTTVFFSFAALIIRFAGAESALTAATTRKGFMALP